MSDIPEQRESIYKTSSKNGKFFTTGNVVWLILWGCFPASRQFTKVSKLLAAALCVVRQHRIPSLDDTPRACVCVCSWLKKTHNTYEFSVQTQFFCSDSLIYFACVWFLFFINFKRFLNSLLKGIARGGVKQRVLQWIFTGSDG